MIPLPFFLADNTTLQQKCLDYASKICFSQPLIPVLLIKGHKCPTGFFASEGYCVPLNRDILGVIPIYNQERPKTCPVGFWRNGDYCQTSPGTNKAALPRMGDFCPLGFYESGDYCFKTCTQY